MSTLVVVSADLLVAVLLVATILSSWRLSRRIARLKADEEAMRTTIAELVSASTAAERAVAALRTTLADCDRDLGERIEMAHRQSQDLDRAMNAGEKVMGALERVFDTTRRAVNANPVPAAPEPEAPRGGGALQAALAAAQAVAERSARRLESRAA